ncbi:hydrolase Nlp/P60 [Geomonas limicola]|uniref:Hydrolase Nlp/P60 n=1 Tax=Geomonas limicola TaxID=2740186 RepID=A0A6V8NDI9_9BACT|nr:NlpC/P60 family N-terminal domain-containing protein [Geomonas limicola]GFO69623.1 hydrolase Nlp/P60 [Geomonas limicola]
MVHVVAIPRRAVGILAVALLLAGCSLKAGGGALAPGAGAAVMEQKRPTRTEEYAIEDLRRIPQELGRLAVAAGERLNLSTQCRDSLLEEFRQHYFAPWRAGASGEEPAEIRGFMRQQGRVTWYGPNQRKVPKRELREILDNCALENFPSQSVPAVAVAPAHLRGLPSYQPLYKSPDDAPFDMISYPQVKLNEPLLVRHASADGVWLFVETAYSSGWLERRDVAVMDPEQVIAWMQGRFLVLIEDYAPVPDGKGVGVFRCKVGTLLPLLGEEAGTWQVAVASASEGGRAEIRRVSLPKSAAAPFPVPFQPEEIALVGNQMLGEPYGWGEIYDLRDCSALLRDFFIPFGIWLPRTSSDQIASIPGRVDLTGLPPAGKAELIKKSPPFLTLLFKPGHIMLYVGLDAAGRPLVFHDAWSIRLAGNSAPGNGGQVTGEPPGQRTQIIGLSAITTLEPGKELGLVPGASLLEKSSELGVLTTRCPASAPLAPPR